MALVEQTELKYEIAVSEKAWLIRLYRWMWGSKAKLDFCHIFWGTVVHLLVWPTMLRAGWKTILWMDRRIDDMAFSRWMNAFAEWVDRHNTKAKNRRSARKVRRRLKREAELKLSAKDRVAIQRQRLARIERRKRAAQTFEDVVTYPFLKLAVGAVAVGKPLLHGGRYTAQKSLWAPRKVAKSETMEELLDRTVEAGSRVLLFLSGKFWWALGIFFAFIIGNAAYWGGETTTQVASGMSTGVSEGWQGTTAGIAHAPWLEMLKYLGLGVGSVVLGVVIFLFLFELIENLIEKKIPQRASRRVGLSSWRTFKLAYRAVKTNTCPRITLREGRPNELARTSGQSQSGKY